MEGETKMARSEEDGSIVEKMARSHTVTAKHPRTDEILMSVSSHSRYDATSKMDAMVELWPDCSISMFSDIPNIDEFAIGAIDS